MLRPDSARLGIDLLGGFSARHPGGAACILPTRKAQALLAYLAVPAGRFHSREKLTALLWGDRPEDQARQSFRQALASLRRATGSTTLLVRQHDTIALDAAAVTVDVADLESALAQNSTEALAHAAALYKGDLLEGFGVDEPPFEEWRVVQRERLREMALEGLARLLARQLRADPPESAIPTALRILAMDPLQEAVHRALMKLLMQQGRRAAALQQYQVCVGWLRRELGVEPEEATRQVYRELLRAAGTRPGASSAPGALSLTAARAAEAPIVGRDRELDVLGGALAHMLDVGGTTVLVSGEAGIGKTRVIQELEARAEALGARLVIGRCHATEQALPLRPWIEALRGEGLTLDPDLRARLDAAAGAQLARVFPELSSAAEVPVTGTQHALLFDALAQLIGELTSGRPMVVVVEDLHWADAMSARFLAYLGRQIHRLPVLIVGSVRPEELVDAPMLAQAITELRTEGRLQELPLGALSEDDTRRLAHSLLTGAHRRQDRDRMSTDVWALSEGNPFVVVESVRALQDASPAVGPRGPRVNARVEDFVGARLERLGPRAGHVVAVAAAIGRDFSFALLSQAVRLSGPEAAEVVEELVRRRLLDAVGDRLDFSHQWIRHVAYERALPSTRTVLHAAIADALEHLRGGDDDVADQLGHHYSKAGNAQKAIPYLIRFAELVAQRYALDDAYAALRQAMDATEQLPRPERNRCRVDVALRQAFVLSLLGRHREVLEILGRHAALVEGGPDAVLASDYYFRLAMTQFYLWQPGQSHRAAERALREGERSGNPERIGKALHVLSLVCYGRGEPQRGIDYAIRGIPLLDHPDTQHYLALVHQDLALNCIVVGALDRALEAARRSDEIGAATHDRRLQALAAYITAWIHAVRGDGGLAITLAEAGIAMAPDRAAANHARGSLGLAHLERGDLAAAIKVLDEVVEQFRTSPNRLSLGRHMVMLSEAHRLAGDLDRSADLATQVFTLSLADDMPTIMGLAQRTLGRIAHATGDHPAGDRHLAEALTTMEACGAMFQAARTRVDLVARCAELGDRATAREHLARAVAVFEAANAPKRVAQARDAARRVGITGAVVDP